MRCVGNESVHMPSPSEFQITDAIAHRNRSLLRAQAELLDNLWLSAVSGQGMVLIKANTNIRIPAQHVGVDVFCSKPQGREHWDNPINKSTGDHMQMFRVVQDPMAVFNQTWGQLVTECLNQPCDMGSIEGEGGQSPGQTLRERQFARHAEVGETLDFRHLGLRVWIIAQDHAGQSIQAFHGT